MSGKPLEKLPGSPGCFICDSDRTNGRALRLDLYWDADTQTVHIPCVPDDSWCGFEGVVHGGLAASVLDEAMAWAVRQTTGDWGFTGECTLRFRRPLQPGERYTVLGRVAEPGRRAHKTEARILDPDGRIMVQAAATFVPVKGRAGPRPATDPTLP